MSEEHTREEKPEPIASEDKTAAEERHPGSAPPVSPDQATVDELLDDRFQASDN